MRWGRVAVIGIAAVAAAAALWWAFQPQPLAVDSAPVVTGNLVVTVDEEGLARIRNVYEISTPVYGELLRLPVEVGDAVEAGETIATILPQESELLDPRSRAEAEAVVRAAEDAVLSGESDLRLAQSELEYWQTEAARKERLLERGIATLQAVQQARLELARRESLSANAEAGLEMRRHQLEQAEARLDVFDPARAADGVRREVLAPADGRVLRIHNESGRNLAAGTPIMEIGQPDDLKIVVDLLSADAIRISVGAPATVSGWGEDRELRAQVSRIEPIGFTKVSALGVEEQRVLVHLDLLDPPEDRARLGHLYRVFVRIESQRVSGATLLPTAALFRAGDAWSVFAVEEGRAQRRTIEIGARTAETVEVVDGIAAGASVIIHPSDLLADGSAVKPR